MQCVREWANHLRSKHQGRELRDHDQAHAGRRNLACRDNVLEQREHSSMASGIVNAHECGWIANREEKFVSEFVSGIDIVGELVSRRDYSTQRAPLNRH